MRTTMGSLIAAVLASGSGLAFGATFYVAAAAGKDTDPGTQERPWRTIQLAADRMRPGDTAVVGPGAYDERIVITISGKSGAPIVFRTEEEASCRGFTIRADFIAVRGFKVTATEASWRAAAHGIYVEGNGCVIEDNDAYYSPRGGIHLRPSSADCIVRNNRAHRNGMVGIEVHGANHLIENNEVWGSIVFHTPSGINNGDCDGFRFFGSGHVFRGNFVHDISFEDPENTGFNPHIDAFQTWKDATHARATNVLFEANRIDLPVYKGSASAPHGSGFTLHNARYVTVRNNIVFAHAGVQTYGRQTAAAGLANHVKVLNNIFRGKLDFLRSNYPLGVMLEKCAYSTVKNNIFLDQTLHAVIVDAASRTGLACSNNLCFNQDGSLPFGTRYPRDIWGLDPMFADPAGGDFRLRAGSPCIDAGVGQAGLVADYDGNPRPVGLKPDIGPYEFQDQAGAALPGTRKSASGPGAAIQLRPSSR